MVLRAFALFAAIFATALPQGGAVAASADPALLRMLRAAVGRADPDARYRLALADLNGDGRPEALVYILSGLFCGSGGCNLRIYAPAGASWRLVTDMSVTQLPIRILATSHRGWRDLGVGVSGGGSRWREALLAFDGRRYPENPTIAPARRVPRGAAGRVVLTDADKALPLFP
jgi:putative lipoprotein